MGAARYSLPQALGGAHVAAASGGLKVHAKEGVWGVDDYVIAGWRGCGSEVLHGVTQAVYEFLEFGGLFLVGRWMQQRLVCLDVPSIAIGRDPFLDVVPDLGATRVFRSRTQNRSAGLTPSVTDAELFS